MLFHGAGLKRCVYFHGGRGRGGSRGAFFFLSLAVLLTLFYLTSVPKCSLKKKSRTCCVCMCVCVEGGACAVMCVCVCVCVCV